MFSDIVLYFSDVLFWLMSGTPIANSLLMFPYIIGITLILSIPFYLVLESKFKKFWGTVAMVSFFPMLLLTMGPPIVQMQMMADCESVVLTGETNRVTSYEIEMQQCRFKDNYYGDFGEWKIVGNRK